MRKRERRWYDRNEGWVYLGKKQGLFNFNRTKKKWVLLFCKISGETLSLYADETAKKRKLEANIKDCKFYDTVERKNRACSIRVVPTTKHKDKKQKPFYIACENLRSIDELKGDLEKEGGIFEGAYSKIKKIQIEKIAIKEWKKQHVLEFINFLGIDEKVKANFNNSMIDGSILLEFDDIDIVKNNIGIGDVKVAEEIVKYVDILKKHAYFKRKQFVVLQKFERFKQEGEKLEGKKSEDLGLIKIVESLSDQSKLKHVFLNTKELTKHTVERSELTKEQAEHATMKIDEEQLIALEKFNTARIHVKLVVTEASQADPNQSKLRKVFSPLVNVVVPKFRTNKIQDVFHTAIIVGPWYLEWTNSELVVPKRMCAGRAIISADVDTLVVKRDGLKEISDKISKVVVKWNTKFKYKSEGGTDLKENQGNCQDFVDDILKALDIQIEFKGALGDFITKMRASGKGSLEFSPCDDFRDFFNITTKSMIFSTHQELDKFVKRIKTECVDLEDVFQSEYMLLKSFDRAFWLRHFADEKVDSYKPLPCPPEEAYTNFPTGCPFKDPRETNSFKG